MELKQPNRKWLDRRMPFLNTQIDNLTMQEALESVRELAEHGKRSYVVTPNADHIVKLEKDALFARVYRDADLILTDGKPLLWIARWLHTPIVEKVSGSDLFPLVCEMAAEQGFTVFFLGARPGVAEKAAENLQDRYPGLHVVGTYSPEKGFEKDKQETDKICTMIRASAPDILFTAMGSPKQEIFYYQVRERMEVPVTLHVGASFDFVAGTKKRAPKWMSDVGLEWFYRLLQEPARMFKRYVIDDMQIFKLYLRYKTGRSRSGSAGAAGHK